MKPGYKTTEFWTTLIGQALALLAILGIIQQGDAESLGDALGQCVAAIFILVGNAWVIVRYVQSRTLLKQPERQVPDRVPLMLWPWLALALLGGGATAQAGGPPAPPRVPACWILGAPPGKAPRDDAALQTLLQQVLHLQRETLINQQTILALLTQRLNPPQQELPIANRPRQSPPIENKPGHELPEHNRPRQELPEPGTPKQELPATPPVRSLQPLPMQRYSILQTPWRR